MSAINTYGSAEFTHVKLHGPVTDLDHAATKGYTDEEVKKVREDLLGPNLDTALDTIRELASFVEDGKVAGGIVSQLSALQFTIDNEASVRLAADVDLATAIGIANSARSAADTQIQGVLTYVGERLDTLSSQHAYQETRFDTEYARTTAAESALQGSIQQEVTRATSVEGALQSSIDVAVQNFQAAGVYTGEQLATKFDKSGGVISGDVAVTGMVMIGPKWRIVAVGSSLEFQYSPDGEAWNVGIPFISV